MKNKRELELFFEHRILKVCEEKHLSDEYRFEWIVEFYNIRLVYMKFDILNKTLINYAFNTFTVYLFYLSWKYQKK